MLYDLPNYWFSLNILKPFNTYSALLVTSHYAMCRKYGLCALLELNFGVRAWTEMEIWCI